MKMISVSGLWAPADGNGLLSLNNKAKGAFPLESCKLLKWNDNLEPADIMVGHSYGFGAIILYLRDHPEVQVKLLVALDGVENWDKQLYQWKEWKIPQAQVAKAVSHHRLAIFPPWSNGIRNTRIQDENHFYFWATHNSIPQDDKIHQQTLRHIGEIRA
jgi:pimeloyl-ACP methyl ester carboxylesterase